VPEHAPPPSAGVIKETIGEGVDAAVNDNLQKCIAHLQSLGAVVEEVGGATLAVSAHDAAGLLEAYLVCAANGAAVTGHRPRDACLLPVQVSDALLRVRR
jgi:hypothetical protein